jgi:hypothetical protein
VVPGDFNLVLLDQLLENENMEQIGCCNELNASYAVAGYARVNGCGAVVTTMNVGAFSARNGVAGAYAARLPVIFVSSGYNTNDEGANHFLHHSIGTHDCPARGREEAAPSRWAAPPVLGGRDRCVPRYRRGARLRRGGDAERQRLLTRRPPPIHRRVLGTGKQPGL